MPGNSVPVSDNKQYLATRIKAGNSVPVSDNKQYLATWIKAATVLSIW